MVTAKLGPHTTATGAMTKDYYFFPTVVESRHHSCMYVSLCFKRWLLKNDPHTYSKCNT